MDVNGTSFYLLLGKPDWAACENGGGEPLFHGGRLAAAEYSDARDELSLRRELFRFPTPARDRAPRATDRRGADADRFGNVYWVDAQGAGVMVRSTGTGRASRFWSSLDEGVPQASGAFRSRVEPAARPFTLAGLAVTEDHYLVVGAAAPAGLLCFDLVAGGPPSFMPWPVAPFVPFDLARRADGGVWILDAEHRQVWEVERDFRIRTVARDPDAAPPGAFASAAPGPVAAPAVEVRAADAFPVAPGVIAIAAWGGGFVVLDHDTGPRLSLHRERTEPALRVDLAAVGPWQAHDLALAGDTAYVADGRGNQAFAFSLALESGALRAELVPSYLPLRLFAGKGLVAGPKGLLYDFADGWIPLVAQPRSRHAERAVIDTPVFDGREPGCVWHRLFLDGRFEPGSEIAVFSAASDERTAFDAPDWQAEPAPLRRAGGSELPFAEALDGYDTAELLFQRARGRYLRVRLVLTGDGRATPRLRALRASFPRFSYLERYLPAVYSEDPVSASFLDRYLANLEGFFTSVEDKIAAAQVLLDPGGAPSEALDWLARFFDAALDPAWDDATRRLFLRHATELFRRRGTARGVLAALRLGLEGKLDPSELEDGPPAGAHRARIVETFRARRTPGVLWGDPTDLGEPRVLPGSAWTPVQGRVALHAAYKAYLVQAGEAVGAVEQFPLARPEGPRGAAWQRFAEATLGFVPGARTPAMERAWRGFLARRYVNSAAIKKAYGPAALGIENAVLPTAPPPDGAPLLDWFEFHSIVLPMRRRAHRFTVLVPTPVGGELAEIDPEELRRRVMRIVELQKPAHTVFDVRFFWAAFRIGEARLGEDTLIDLGSRAPELLEAFVLGRRYLGESFLGGEPASDRIRRQELP